MAGGLTTRSLVESDLDEILDLMRSSLGESGLLKRTPEMFAWKHFKNPFGRSIGLVAESSGGEIVGLRTFMRWELSTPGRERLRCIRAVDTATHPEFQRQGIFRRLTEEAIEMARADGVHLVFNTPNSKSKPGYLKMGWLEVGAIGALLRPSLRFLAHPRTHFETSPDPDAEPYVNTGSQRDRAPLGLRTPREANYLRWRYTEHPTADYFLAGDGEGVAVVRPNVRRGRRELVVADVFGPPGEGLRAAVSSSRADYLGTFFQKGTVERRAAARVGFLPIPGYKALQLVMRPLVELPASYRQLSAWDISVGDFELL